MKRMHVNLKTHDLDASVRFYTALFGAAPTKREPDYAKWMLDDPRVNFSLSQTEGEAGIEHLGIEAETTGELADLRAAVARAERAVQGARVVEESETTCCYANSDKTWVRDPQRVEWELFHTHGESETYFAEGEEATKSPAPSRCCTGENAGTACC